jgi:hypothetical protein
VSYEYQIRLRVKGTLDVDEGESVPTAHEVARALAATVGHRGVRIGRMNRRFALVIDLDRAEVVSANRTRRK